MDEVAAQKWSDLMKQRLFEDDKNLRYGENTVNFYYYFVQAIMAKKDGDIKQAKQFYRISIPFAKGLKAEKEIVQTSSSHANIEDGLKATRVEKNFLELGEKLGLDFNK